MQSFDQFLFFELYGRQAGTIRGRMDVSRVHPVEVDTVLLRFDYVKVDIQHAFKLFEHFGKFVAKREVLIGYHKLLSQIGARLFV